MEWPSAIGALLMCCGEAIHAYLWLFVMHATLYGVSRPHRGLPQ